jgi:hypothetical protein
MSTQPLENIGLWSENGFSVAPSLNHDSVKLEGKGQKTLAEHSMND